MCAYEKWSFQANGFRKEYIRIVSYEETWKPARKMRCRTKDSQNVCIEFIYWPFIILVHVLCDVRCVYVFFIHRVLFSRQKICVRSNERPGDFDKSSRIWFVKIGSVVRSVGCNSVAWHVMRSPVSVHFSLLFPVFAKLCDQTKRSKSNQLGAVFFLIL